jgi:peptide/nickel transport system substrate-binding protein
VGLRRALLPVAAVGALVALAVAAVGSPTSSTAAKATATSSSHPLRPGRLVVSHRRIAAKTTTTTTTTTTTSTTTTTTLPGQGTIVLENGGTVTVAVPSLPTSLDPLLPAGANRITTMTTAQIWPSVFTINNKLVPILNSQFITSAYLTSLLPQTIVYTIAKGATWSDGVPITAIDFINEWHEQLAYGSELPAEDPVSGYEDIASISGSNGGRTVTVTFKTIDSSWEALFSPLLPAHVASVAGEPAAFATSNVSDWISGGPFMIANFVPGVELELARNPSYWGTPARVQNIIFTVVRGDRAVLRGLRTGSVGVGVVSPGDTEAALVAGMPGLVSDMALSPTQWQIAFNLAGPTLAQPGVRHAIALAIDRHEIVADSVDLQTAGTPTLGNRRRATQCRQRRRLLQGR